VRDLVQELPELLAVIEEAEPGLAEAARTLMLGLPVPSSMEAFVQEPYYRPPGSSRSFYRRLTTSDEAGRGQAVIAVKGMEPLSPSFVAALRTLSKPCYTPYTIAEHFVMEERKVPACLTLDEAVTEAERAAEVQRAHLAAYGHLARVPLPLFVFRHTKLTVERVTRELHGLLSDAGQAAIAASMTSGLGVYVYFYPAAPVRVTHVEHLLRGRSFANRTLRLLALCDPDVTVHRWVATVVRMLYLGYLPGSLASLHSGLCCQPQNACLDGGFVDLESVTPFTALRSNSAVQAAVQLVVEELTRTVSRFLTGGLDDPRLDDDRVRVDRHALDQYVTSLLRDAVETECRPGLEMDRRVLEHLEPAQSLESVVARLSTYFSTPSPDAAQAWQDFEGFGPAWIDGARGSHPGYG
jgi:hypothetical protein